jgi:hypothetical protein
VSSIAALIGSIIQKPPPLFKKNLFGGGMKGKGKVESGWWTAQSVVEASGVRKAGKEAVG